MKKEKGEEKKENKSECCTTKSKSQCSQGSFQNTWLSQFGWLMFDRESQICGVTMCVGGFVKNRFSKSIPFRIFKVVKIPFKMPKQGWVHPLE